MYIISPVGACAPLRPPGRGALQEGGRRAAGGAGAPCRRPWAAPGPWMPNPTGANSPAPPSSCCRGRMRASPPRPVRLAPPRLAPPRRAAVRRRMPPTASARAYPTLAPARLCVLAPRADLCRGGRRFETATSVRESRAPCGPVVILACTPPGAFRGLGPSGAHPPPARPPGRGPLRRAPSPCPPARPPGPLVPPCRGPLPPRLCGHCALPRRQRSMPSMRWAGKALLQHRHRWHRGRAHVRHSV